MARRKTRAVVTVLLLAISACSSSGASPQLRPALEELASVGGPDGKDAFDFTVVDCSDDAEMPAGYASYRHKALESGTGEELNAEIARVTDWYLPKWRRLGWNIEGSGNSGTARKNFDGTGLRATIDVGKGSGYAIVVVEEGEGLCE